MDLMKRMHRGLWIGVLGLLVLGGCRAAPGIDRQFGTYYEHMAAPKVHVIEASRGAIEDMQLQYVDEDEFGPTTRLHAATAFDTRVRISIEERGEQRTRVGVRVSPGGDEGLSLEVLNRIRTRLQS